jgi:tRNA pseudouridine38-40 synthase
MRNIKLTIAYDGTSFRGWQIQPGLPTIQGAIADAASQITQEKVFIQGASRTDAGVHALGQVAHFKTQSALPTAEFQRALNALIPPAIRIVAAEEVGPDFHARWQAQGKTYRYRIYRGLVLPPFDYRRALHYSGPLDESAMAAAAREFEGERDFSSFAASSGSKDDDRERETVRVILSSEIIREPDRDEIVYVVRGRSFLRYMVRKIVGTLIEVGKGRLTPADIPQIFEARDRSRSGPTVPPEGLYLVSLEYPDPTDSLASTASRSFRRRTPAS